MEVKLKSNGLSDVGGREKGGYVRPKERKRTLARSDAKPLERHPAASREVLRKSSKLKRCDGAITSQEGIWNERHLKRALSGRRKPNPVALKLTELVKSNGRQISLCRRNSRDLNLVANSVLCQTGSKLPALRLDFAGSKNTVITITVRDNNSLVLFVSSTSTKNRITTISISLKSMTGNLKSKMLTRGNTAGRNITIKKRQSPEEDEVVS